MSITSSSKQVTLKKEGSLKGVGIHSGAEGALFFKPAPVNSGIRFFKNGKEVSFSGLGSEGERDVESLRSTALGSGADRIRTTEHVLAAIVGLGISNLSVEVSGPEVPEFDGSSEPFVKFLKEIGIVQQEAGRDSYSLAEPIFCHENGKAIAAFPSDELRVAYIFDHEHPLLGVQKADFLITPDVFEKEISPARTFCTEEEGLQARENGFGMGANYENTLVLSKTGLINNHFRFDDECARHKVLDIVGDLGLLGFSLCARIVGVRSGHSLNHKLVQEIKRQREASYAGK